MKQYIRIEITRELGDEEIKYFNELSDNEKQYLIDEQKSGIINMFNNQGIKSENFTKVEIEVSEGKDNKDDSYDKLQNKLKEYDDELKKIDEINRDEALSEYYGLPTVTSRGY